MVASLLLWNSLYLDARQALSVDIFRRQDKTDLFRLLMGINILIVQYCMVISGFLLCFSVNFIVCEVFTML